MLTLIIFVYSGCLLIKSLSTKLLTMQERLLSLSSSFPLTATCWGESIFI